MMPRVLLAIIIASIMLMYSNMLSAGLSPQFPNVKYQSLTKYAQEQVKCLAENIYFESVNESNKGKLAVAFVTLNRTRHKDFPESVCDVVKQKRKNVCQFSWVCLVKNKTPKDKEMYSKILDMASMIYVNYDKIVDPTSGALYYHADYVKPKWNNMSYTTTIGKHIFYTLKAV